jgi:hypothetical protein
MFDTGMQFYTKLVPSLKIKDVSEKSAENEQRKISLYSSLQMGFYFAGMSFGPYFACHVNTVF